MNNLFEIETLVQRASRYNLDQLLEYVCHINKPEDVRRELLTLYFHGAQAIFNSGDSAGDELANAFFTLQSLIEALDTVNDVKGAKTRVTAI